MIEKKLHRHIWAFGLLFATAGFLGRAQENLDLSTLLSGVGMNAVVHRAQSKTEKTQEDNGQTISHIAITAHEFIFLGFPVTALRAHMTNGMVDQIIFEIEKDTIPLVPAANSSWNQSDIPQLVKEKATITNEIRAYLDQQSDAVHIDPDCQFDCQDRWETGLSEIILEKNNYLGNVNGSTHLFVDHTIGIQLKKK